MRRLARRVLSRESKKSPPAARGTISTQSPGTWDPPHIGQVRHIGRRCPGSSPTASEASLPLTPPPSVASRHEGGSRVSGGEGGHHVPAATPPHRRRSETGGGGPALPVTVFLRFRSSLLWRTNPSSRSHDGCQHLLPRRRQESHDSAYARRNGLIHLSRLAPTGTTPLLGPKTEADSSLPATTPSTDVRGSPPLRRPVGRAIDTARFQEVHEIALGDANAVQHTRVVQFAASTERVDATSRYAEAFGNLTNRQERSRSVLETWQHSGSKRSRRICNSLQTVGLGGLPKWRDSNRLRVLTTPCQPVHKACHAGGRGFKSRPPRKTPWEKS